MYTSFTTYKEVLPENNLACDYLSCLTKDDRNLQW